MGIEAFVDRQRESSGWIAGVEVAECGKGVGTAEPRRSLKETLQSTRMVRAVGGERARKSAARFSSGAEMKAKEGDRRTCRGWCF